MIDEQHCGKQVKCGKCGQPFAATPAPAEAPRPAPPVAGTPPPAISPAAAPQPAAPASPAHAPVQPALAAGGSALGGLFSGLKGFYRSMAGRRRAAADADDVGIALDGPAASLPPEPEAPPSRSSPGKEIPPLPGVWRLDVGSATTAGCVRPRNEDSFLVQQLAWGTLDQRHEAALIVVADGMGGYDAGDQASSLVIRTVGGSLAALFGEFLTGQAKNGAPARIEVALKAANKAVHARSQTDPGCKGMGATAAVAFICDGLTHVGHIGDCRVYHHHEGKFLQITKDQTLVARMVELGQLKPEEALTHPKRNEVTQAVGRHPDLQPAAYQLKLSAGDWLIVACDGLHAHVEAEQLARVVAAAPPSAAGLAHHLVDLANEGGGTDNCTVVAVRCY
jgi:protein phosphatase